VAGRLLCLTLLLLSAACGEIARADGKYQSTRDGKALVWNNDPTAGDVATWSGDRDRNEYARGFGRLIWYTKEPGSKQPQVFARYWGRMVDGKLEGPVNVHSKRKTSYAIFIEGARVTKWTPGTAPVRANRRWRTLLAQRTEKNRARGIENLEPEPDSPAAGPTREIAAAGDQRSHQQGPGSEGLESIQDLYGDRWPKIDIDDSLRVLAFPPRTLRR
jgi:hypothetical protein